LDDIFATMSSKSYIVGIAGGSGSGKTTFLNALFGAFPENRLALVSQDNYYKTQEEQEVDKNGWANFDLPSSIDDQRFLRDLKLLSTGRSITKMEYTFNNPALAPKQITINPAPIIIIEGLFVFHYPEINSLLDYRVYFHADEEERLRRRIQRDYSERGYPEREVRYQWENHVIPAERKWLEPYRHLADQTIDNTDHYQEDLEKLIEHFNRIDP
jgi:uridine kinase